MEADGGNQENLTNNPASDDYPTWSPDGKKIAFVSNRNEGYIQIWVIDADGKNPMRLTNGVWDQWLDWSPDGKKIAYDVLLHPLDVDKWTRVIYVMDADGQNKRQLTKAPGYDGHASWSPDSKKIVFSSSREGGATAIYVMEADGRNQKRITHDFAGKYMPSWSPDGKRIAYVHNAQIYVMDSNGENQRRMTEKGRNRYPTWSPDSDTVAFESWGRDDPEPGIYLIGVRSGALKQISQVHKHGDYEPDWLNPVGLSVSPAGNQVNIWGRLKKLMPDLQ